MHQKPSQQCTEKAPKAIPAVTQVQMPSHWKAPGGASTWVTAHPHASHGPAVAAGPDAEPQPLRAPQHLLSSAGEERPHNLSEGEMTYTDTNPLTFSERPFHGPLYVSLLFLEAASSCRNSQ